MNEYKKWQAKLVCQEMVALLREKGYDAHYAEDLKEAVTMAGELVNIDTETGRCLDCQVQKRLCNYLGVIYHGRKFPGPHQRDRGRRRGRVLGCFSDPRIRGRDQTVRMLFRRLGWSPDPPGARRRGRYPRL